MSSVDWRLFAVGSAFFAALTAIFGKIGVSGINSNLATLIRTVVIFFVCVVLVTMQREWVSLAKVDSKTLVFLVLSGIATGLSWLCYYHALQLGPVSKVAPIDKLSVAMAMILALVFLGEKLTLKVALGGSLIVIGSLVLAF